MDINRADHLGEDWRGGGAGLEAEVQERPLAGDWFRAEPDGGVTVSAVLRQPTGHEQKDFTRPQSRGKDGPGCMAPRG